MRCVFLWQKHTLRYYEKAETSERSRLSCGNSVAGVFGCHAHERGFRHIDDSCARIHFESGRTNHFRSGGICDSSDTLRDILHRDEKFSHLLLVVVYNLPALRCGAGSFQTYPDFHPAVTPPGSMDLWVRIVMFILGVPMSAFSIALFSKTYLYPEVYDLFFMGISKKYCIKTAVFKTCFDAFMLVLGTTMTLAFFKKFVGINWGTLVMTVCNGTLISLFSKLLDKCIDVKPIFKRFASHFALDEPIPTRINHSAYVREI